MAPERSKSAKPGGLRLPGTFNSPPTASPSPRRPASSNSSPSLKPNRTVSSVPASRLTSTKPILPGTGTSSGGLLSSFGSGERSGGGNSKQREPTRLERLERARSSPNVAKDDGVSRLRSLGLNRALPRQRSPSPEEESPEEGSDDEDYRRRSQTPKPSWGRKSSGEEEEARPREATRRRRRSFSPSRTSSPSATSRRSSPPIVIPPENHEHDATEEGKGTLFGSLWNRASQAWNGGATETHVVKEGEGNQRGSLTENLEPPESKVTPFRISKSGDHEDEASSIPSHSPPKEPSNFLNTRPTPLSQHRKSQLLSEPSHEPVEPITYHRPPDLHPRNILLNSVSRGRRNRDQYDWLESLDESPLDPFLFHRSATRMATKKVRVKRPPPVGMATAPAILAGVAHTGVGAMARNGTFAHQGAPSAQSHSTSSLSPGVFVSQASSGPVQAFSQPPHQPSAYAPFISHPGPPPVPPPIPPGYHSQSHSSSSSGTAVAATAGLAGTIATSQPLSSALHPPNPNALPSFPAPSSQPPSQSSSQIGSAQPVQSRPLIPPMPIAPPLPSFSSAPVQLPYSYIPTAAPLGYPAPVFTAPAVGVPSTINTAAPLGDEYKTAIAKKLFGSRISDAPGTVGAASAQGMVPSLPVSQTQSQNQSQGNHRLPTPAAPTTSDSISQSTPSSTEIFHAPLNHGVLPPMPIPQSITPKPTSSNPSSFYAPHLAASFPPISYAPPRPMTGSGGWILPPSVSPLLTPEPVLSSSPVPSDGNGRADTPALPPSPVPTEKLAHGAGSDKGDLEDQADKTEDPNLPSYDSSTPRPPSTVRSPSPSPTTVSSDKASESTSAFLSLPSLAALATPLPPSPAPSSFLSSSSPALPDPIPSPALTLPEIHSSIETDEYLPSYWTSKALPPSPSPSPSLPPLPTSTSSEFSSIFSVPSPISSPAIPPLPSPSPALPLLPQIDQFPSTTITLPSSPPPPSSFSVERTQSLAISTNSIPSPPPSDNLEIAQILLQPPTPIEPISSSTSPILGPLESGEEVTVAASAPSLPLEPLSLNLDLGFDFDFSTPSLLPESLQDTKSYFSSVGLEFDEQNEAVERDGEGRLELPVLREENLVDEEEEVEDQGEDGDDMSDQFDAATSFVSGFRETDLARAKVDPGHTGRTERWLAGQGVRREEGIEGLTKQVEVVPKGQTEEPNSTIYRPRTAPPSSIPPSSIPPAQSTIMSRPPPPSIPTNYLALRSSNLVTLNEDEDNTATSPVQTMINFDRSASALNRGREISSSYGSKGGNLTSGKDKEEIEKRQAAFLGALSNQAFTRS